MKGFLFGALLGAVGGVYVAQNYEVLKWIDSRCQM